MPIHLLALSFDSWSAESIIFPYPYTVYFPRLWPLCYRHMPPKIPGDWQLDYALILSRSMPQFSFGPCLSVFTTLQATHGCKELSFFKMDGKRMILILSFLGILSSLTALNYLMGFMETRCSLGAPLSYNFNSGDSSSSYSGLPLVKVIVKWAPKGRGVAYGYGNIMDSALQLSKDNANKWIGI
jgi:hypothetical protein